MAYGRKVEKKKIVGLPLSEDYREGGIMYDPSQVAPKKEAKKASKK